MKIIRFLLPRLEYVLLTAFFWGIAASGPKILNFDGDLPRHLVLGHVIRTTGRVPLVDVYSFRTAGFPSIPHEWLSQVVLSITYDLLGLSGVVLLAALIVTATWWVVYAEARRRSNSLLISLLLTAVGMGVSMIHVLPRPHLFTYLFTALWIMILERIQGGKPRLWWLLPALMLLWVNMHGMFVLGILLWGIYSIGSLLDEPSRAWFAKTSTKSMALGGATSLLATFLSPSGPQIWGSVISLGSNSYITSMIPEYQSANFHLPGTWPFLFLLAVTILAFGRSAQRSSWIPILLAVAFSTFALYTSRMIPLFAIVVVPIAAQTLGDWIRQEYPRSRFWTIEKNLSTIESSSNGVVWMLVVFLGLVVIFKAGATIDPQKKGNLFDPAFFPVQAVDWLNAHPQQGHMFNEFDWGGYLLLRLEPQQQIFMDGHTHIYGEKLTREYETVISVRKDWLMVLEKYQVQWAIVRSRSPLVDALEDNRWKVLYEDDTAAILQRP